MKRSHVLFLMVFSFNVFVSCVCAFIIHRVCDAVGTVRSIAGHLNAKSKVCHLIHIPSIYVALLLCSFNMLIVRCPNTFHVKTTAKSISTT